MSAPTLDRRPRAQWGTLPVAPTRYGQSVLGLPLEVWRPTGRCEVLLFAAIHGEEPETTWALSRALRQLDGPLAHAAVVLAANPDGLIRGTRGNANGVDLNRNFPARNWQPGEVLSRATVDAPRDVVLHTGASAGSEPETQALLALIAELQPDVVIALHAPLACIDDPANSALGHRLAERTGMPLVPDVGYATPGSFGSWCADQALPVITYELPVIAPEDTMAVHVPVFVDLLTGTLR
ncbi:MAG: murein tripeptide amidase MpaA [Gemmatimonadaceae bacterium]|jgi:protein MpaA|nr:murein tripeptide amidase MpaA [Gemmatimonadaceae bacterium]